MNEMSLATVSPAMSAPAGAIKDLYEIGEIPPLGHVPKNMAKLLAARVAWAAADNALQIHGGNGFALEYPVSRVLCDARILSIFEGAAEIQAQVIARRLLES